MPTITRIIDPSFRSGTGKSGKPWVMMKIEADGKEASIFAPASVGDEVSLTYNDQYKNWNAEKMTPQKQEKAQLEDTLKTILSSLGRIERHLGVNPVGVSASGSDNPSVIKSAPEQQPTDEVPPITNYTPDQEPEINLDEIPF